MNKKSNQTTCRLNDKKKKSVSCRAPRKFPVKGGRWNNHCLPWQGYYYSSLKTEYTFGAHQRPSVLSLTPCGYSWLTCLRAVKWQMTCHVKANVLPFSPEPQKQSEWLTTLATAAREEADWPPDPGWMTGKMTPNKRSDSTPPYNMFLLSLVAGWGWRSGGPSDPNINNHNPFIMLLHNTHPFPQTSQSLYLAKRPDQRQAI